MTAPPTFHIVTLGCARNDADSEELAGKLVADGFLYVDDPEQAEVVFVNTCGFIEAAKKDSIDTLLELTDLLQMRPQTKIVASGCLVQRHGSELADSLGEVDAFISFDDYPQIAQQLRQVIGDDKMGQIKPSPWHGRFRLDDGPSAVVKIASGCDRRCAFCAIPSIRGRYQSRPIDQIVNEANWLVDQGVREIVLVSENSTGYGKDWRQLQALETLLAKLVKIDGLDWLRLSYLQPAELRPSLLETILGEEKVVPYFDLSFQHASGPLLRRMRRFGDGQAFLELLDSIRSRCPTAGLRTGVIVGFPGETEDDFAKLHDFLGAARADAIGVFAFSDEEGTEAHQLDGHLPAEVISQRTQATTDLVSWLTSDRARERIGEVGPILIESVGQSIVGRATHQAPEVDGVTTLYWPAELKPPAIGDLVWAEITDAQGVDLLARPI